MDHDNLRSIYEDESMNADDREHAYYGYWKAKLNRQATVTRSDLADLFRHPRFVYPINDLVGTAAEYGKLTDADLDWLIEQMLNLPVKLKWGVQQILSRKALRDDSLDTLSKLKVGLDNHAAWACIDAINLLRPSEITKAIEMVSASMLKDYHKTTLLSALETHSDYVSQTPPA